MNKKRQCWIKHAKLGPGGMHCPCCGPAPGESKRKCLRTAKRRMRQAVKKEIEEEEKET